MYEWWDLIAVNTLFGTVCVHVHEFTERSKSIRFSSLSLSLPLFVTHIVVREQLFAFKCVYQNGKKQSGSHQWVRSNLAGLDWKQILVWKARWFHLIIDIENIDEYFLLKSCWALFVRMILFIQKSNGKRFPMLMFFLIKSTLCESDCVIDWANDNDDDELCWPALPPEEHSSSISPSTRPTNMI